MADSTRIDKFLWSIRVFKTRADATEACKGGKVTVNGQDAKPSKEVKGGDVISVRKGAIHYTYKVLLPIEKRQGAKEVEKYAQNLTPESELKKMNAPVETFFVKRDRGAGRPTKKERREMDVLYDTLWDSSDSLDGD
ncbi:MAG: RNA-binding S4 domain-containing protein [Bacteroidales bacterium]|jgi:ribosome-associated heat shock protein Hsp15|nr:RNA-binding S4 domain-containing protein [Bacteroidales bacterium]MBO7584125.1 RNA-binding S4 domain-containing protein [Bacteroidales bacterium]MBP5316137.1 RNA-binding S4 domain-containing protein [Bacteroidales bacterium]MBQ4022330.1 RNA-binding S4 domain-containing protein [Bacteroidales bacterium]MBR3526273.1 RNA-binding S4 domain-containing protein [Bacteroidales bacterium]